MSERVIVVPEIAPEEVEENWRENANCRGVDPELFFPVGTGNQATKQTKVAKAMCMMCIAQKHCLEYAMVEGEELGIWGGTSEDERHTYRKTWLAEKMHNDRTF